MLVYPCEKEVCFLYRIELIVLNVHLKSVIVYGRTLKKCTYFNVLTNILKCM